VSESTDRAEPFRRELDELLAALRQPPRADEVRGETEAVASMVAAFNSPTHDRAPGRRRSRGLHVGTAAASLVVVVAGVAGAAPHLLKSTGTRSVVPSATSTLGAAQADGIGPQTSLEEPAQTSIRVGDAASSQLTTPADAAPEPAMTQPAGEFVDWCADRDLGSSTSSTVHESSPAALGSSPSAPATTFPRCGQTVDDGQSTTASSAISQARPEGDDSDLPSNTAPGPIGQPGPGSDSPSNTAPGRIGQPGPGSDSLAYTAPGRVDRPASDEASAADRTQGRQGSDPRAAEDDDSEPGEDDSEAEPDD
jgi:hypothetical protein